MKCLFNSKSHYLGVLEINKVVAFKLGLSVARPGWLAGRPWGR